MYKSVKGPIMSREAQGLASSSLSTISDVHSALLISRGASSFFSTSESSESSSLSSSITFDPSSLSYAADGIIQASDGIMNSTKKMGSAGDPYIFFMAGPTLEYWYNFDAISSVLPPSSTVKTSYHAYLLPIFSLITIFALIIPFTLHLRLRNTGAWSLILVLIIGNTLTFLNALIWPNSDFRAWYNGVGLCDVEAKIIPMLVAALASCTLCIIRSLCHVLDIDRCSINPSRSMKRRGICTDLVICWGVPFLIGCASYVVQPNRYVIVELIGCVDTYATTWPTIVIVSIWPVIFVFGTVWYTILTLHRLRLHSHSISCLLSLASLPTSRFLRLFLLSTCILLIYLPTRIYYFTLNLSFPLTHYSWTELHSGGNIGKEASWNSVGYAVAGGPWLLDAYLGLGQAGLVFVFFGLGSEAKRSYRGVAMKLGLNRVFTSLGRENGRPEETWVTKLSPIRWLRRKFDRWIGRQTQGSEVTQGNSMQEMLGRGGGTRITASTCDSEKGSAAVIEFVVPAHPAAVLGTGLTGV